MADVSLDDLIKKDKEKDKINRLKQKLKPKKFANRPNNNQDDRQPRGNHPNKKKFIQKRANEGFDDRRDKRGAKQPNEQNRDRPKPKFEKKEETGENTEKQFRTIKVMGLSPEFTNEDLYLFATEGAMEKCHIEQDNFGRTLTTAIVKYYEPDSAKSAIQNLNRHKIMNCVLTVEPYKNVKK